MYFGEDLSDACMSGSTTLAGFGPSDKVKGQAKRMIRSAKSSDLESKGLEKWGKMHL